MLFGAMDHLDLNDNTSIGQHYENRLRLLELYDKSGFYGFHTTEHHCTPLGGGASPSVFLSAAAQRTRRLRLGTLVYILPAYHPIRLVEEIAMLDQMSNGRMDLGFGRGSVPMELEFMGINPEQSREIYEEALTCVTQGLQNHVINFRGKYFQIADAPIFQKPVQRPMPPIWYGVHSIESAEKAAMRGFNIVCNEPAPDSAKYIAHFKKTWHSVHGAKPLAKIGLARAIVVGPSDTKALSLATRAHAVFQSSFRFLHLRNGTLPRLSGREANFEELEAGGRGIAAAPPRVADFIERQMKETGADYCVMRMAFGDMSFEEMAGSVKLFVDNVMPRVLNGHASRSSQITEQNAI